LLLWEVWWFQRGYTFGLIKTDAQAGAGISMATDIAFALSVLSLLGIVYHYH
jgi:Na+/H+ antiporter NhaA